MIVPTIDPFRRIVWPLAIAQIFIFTGSAVLGSLLLALLAMVTELWQFYTVWLLIGMAMSGGLYEACFAILTRVMGTRAKQAITLVTLVAGFAGTLAFPGTHALVGIFGWRGTVLSFATAIILIATPLIWSGCRFSERHAETQAVIASNEADMIWLSCSPLVHQG